MKRVMTRVRRSVAGAVAAAGLASTITVAPVGTATAATRQDPDDGVQQALDAMVAAGAPGVLARIDGRKGPRIRRSGVADLDTERPIPRAARFRAASLTKSVVSVAVLQLVTDGAFGLDDRIADRLPNVVDDERITIRQLLNHSSGMADYLVDPEFEDPAVYSRRTYSPERLMEYATNQETVSEPGRKFHYANAGYIALGMLVEQTTGKALRDVLDDRVLRPAGMNRSYLPTTDPRIHGPHPTGYYGSGDDPKPLTELNPSFAWAAYGLVSDARDLNRFYRALLGGRLLDPALAGEMRANPIPTPQAPVFPHYGLGLESAGLSCGEMWGHTGSIPGYVTLSFASADGRRAMTISTNLQPAADDTGRIVVAGIDALNRYFCGEPYAPPTRSIRLHDGSV